jgi:HSP20 family protein
MYVIKVRPGGKLGSLSAGTANLWDEMMKLSRPMMSPSDAGWTPEADLFETDRDICVVVNLAGVQKEEIEVSFHQNHLRVAGNRLRNLPSGSPTHFHHMEIGHGEFERVFRIPAAVDDDHISASCAEGLLTVRMKKRVGPQAVHIEVKP